MQNELQFVGNIAQLFKVREVKLGQGRGRDVRIIEVDNHSGLTFEVAIDRGFDIPFLNYKGNNFGYISPCGISSPEYFDDNAMGFLKNFTAGFLTTCGLKTIGSPSVYQEKPYGLHGNYANTPADNHSYDFHVDDTGTYVELKATVRDANIFEDRLRLDRSIRCYYQSRKLTIDDVVTNDGFRNAMHAILYHMNIGYPLLSPESQLYIDSGKVVPRNKHAQKFQKNWQVLEAPSSDFEEVCYYHQLRRNDKGESVVGVFNPNLEIGVAITIDCSTLDHFVQWKMMRKGDYVIGLEPGNNRIEGVQDNADNNRLKYISPGEQIAYHLEIEILDKYSDFEKLNTN